MAESDNKLYIGSLGPETDTEALRSHFAEFGELSDCVVMADAGSGRSRGFGFVTFSEPASAAIALVESHMIDGHEVTIKRAVRERQVSLVRDADGVYNSTKIFVGGLPSSCSYEKLTGYFGRYGEIQDAVVMIDAQTQRHRGFGYVTYSTIAAVEAAIAEHVSHKIDGKWIDVKRCIPQDVMRDKGKGKGGAPPSSVVSKGGGGKGYNPANFGACGSAWGAQFSAPPPAAAWYGNPYGGFGYPPGPYGPYGMAGGGAVGYGGYGGGVPRQMGGCYRAGPY
eukprot:NODE_12621_length_1213_cov_6.041436.p1 GENE.NODE_12621_length_1213_cov_6.041436~~NODE_12621_length_1213_cov_6.041436.p1  ORF type:complete len:280 (-),score=64.30 NODE_12621_length_1213_cov_6.041436:264-1103(-)